MNKKGVNAHLGLHALKSYHVINGKVYSKRDDKDRKCAFIFQNRDKITIKSFWFNYGYVIDIVKPIIGRRFECFEFLLYRYTHSIILYV